MLPNQMEDTILRIGDFFGKTKLNLAVHVENVASSETSESHAIEEHVYMLRSNPANGIQVSKPKANRNNHSFLSQSQENT